MRKDKYYLSITVVAATFVVEILYVRQRNGVMDEV